MLNETICTNAIIAKLDAENPSLNDKAKKVYEIIIKEIFTHIKTNGVITVNITSGSSTGPHVGTIS